MIYIYIYTTYDIPILSHDIPMVSPCCLPPPAAPSLPLVGVERAEAWAQNAAGGPVPLAAPLAPGGKPSPGNPGNPGLPPSFLMINDHQDCEK
jgi:hypothetical protein